MLFRDFLKHSECDSFYYYGCVDRTADAALCALCFVVVLVLLFFSFHVTLMVRVMSEVSASVKK